MVASITGTRKDSNYAMPVDISLTLTNGTHSTMAMLDTGADRNFIAKSLLLGSGWQPPSYALPPVEFVDGKSTGNFGIVRLSTTITDSRNDTKSYDLEFTVINMSGFEVILGKPWLAHLCAR